MKFFTAFLRGAATTMTPTEQAQRIERMAATSERVAQKAAAAGDQEFARAAQRAAALHRGVANDVRKAGEQ